MPATPVQKSLAVVMERARMVLTPTHVIVSLDTRVNSVKVSNKDVHAIFLNQSINTLLTL